MNITIDGFMSGPDCELDWHFRSWTKEMGETLCTQLAAADTILLGRKTYCAMAKYWPSKTSDPHCRGEDFAFANMMNNHYKIVISETLKQVEWHNSKLLKKRVDVELRNLKEAAGKNIMVYGSGQLAKTLVSLDLIDEYHLWLHPVMLGKGKAFFSDNYQKRELKLFESKTFNSGVIFLQYQIIKNKQR